MRDIKIVAYLKDVSEDNEGLIWHYLLDKGVIQDVDVVDDVDVHVPRMTFYTVDPRNALNDTITTQGELIAQQNQVIEDHVARIEYLECNTIEGFIDKDMEDVDGPG